MTYLRLANIAYLQALDRWYNHKKNLEDNPDDEREELLERDSWQELKEIEEIIIKLQKEINENET